MRWNQIGRNFVSAVLLFALLLPSCGQAQASETMETQEHTGTSETVAVPEVAVQDISPYVIVRPDGDVGLLTMMQSIRARIKNITGVEILPANELMMPGKSAPECEILLGETVREQSRQVYASLALGEYAVVREGKRIIIAGRGNEPLEAAVKYFFTNYFADGALVFPEETEYRAAYEYDAFYEVLVGKTINVMGDSYVSPTSLDDGKIWPQLLAEKYAMNYRNYGKGGNGIASPEATGTPMVSRYHEMNSKADIVFVVGGRNDYNKSYPVGKVGDTTTDTFCGALSVLIDGLRAKYPNTLILFSTSWYVNEDMKAYTDATLAVCQSKGIPCFHAADQSLSGVRMNDSSFRSRYCIKPTDVSHLNADGMKLVLPAFEKFIGEQAELYFGQ